MCGFGVRVTVWRKGARVSWQEELRKLDEELAAGQISADDYRVRRDQVLSSAVSSGPGQPQQEATQFIQQPLPPPPPPAQPVRPVQQPRGGDSDDDADKTQIVPGDADRTQAVGGWRATRPPGDGDRTQVVPGVVPGVPPQSYAAGMPPRPAPGYQQPWPGGDEFSPPWAGSDFPPLVAPGNPDWIRQGPELFEGGGRSNTGRVLLIILVVLVVAGLGTGAYFFFTRDKGSPAAQSTTSSQSPPTTTTTVRPKDDLEIAKLPGNGGEKTDIKTFSDVEKGQFLTEAEKQVYRVAEAGKARLVESGLPDGSDALILTVEAASPSHAAAARDDLVKLQHDYTMKNYTGTTPPGVVATQFEKSDQYPAVIRAHYIHKNTIVRVQVSGSDLASISKTFDQIIALELGELSANAS
jgi:hypothetical protein